MSAATATFGRRSPCPRRPFPPPGEIANTRFLADLLSLSAGLPATTVMLTILLPTSMLRGLLITFLYTTTLLSIAAMFREIFFLWPVLSGG